MARRTQQRETPTMAAMDQENNNQNDGTPELNLRKLQLTMHLELEPANEDYENIVVDLEHQDFHIEGKSVGLLRKN